MIHVEGLTFTYPKAHAPAIQDITFDVAPGEIVGFLGPSGAGKSTTQKILIGLLKGYLGRVVVMGRELREWDRSLYEHIGVSFELPNHYPRLSALENLRYFRALYSGPTEDPLALLTKVRLADDAHTPVAQFSKGMKLRLNIARSLLPRPKLLFLDEPTSGLDPLNAHMVMNLVREKQAQGTTVFLTTHSMNVAEALCDRVAFIVEGRLRLMDSPRSLKLRYGRRLVQVEYLNDDGALHRREFNLDGLGHDPEFIALLQTTQVQTIHSAETTLDRIFIQVTGKELG